MPLYRLLTVISLVALSFAGAPDAAAARAGHVKASLVAADTSVRPGESITVALRLLHDPHWHTYWKNPGTGLPTEIKWTLPPGWTAGEIQWPAPMVLKDKAGAVVGNGYEGELFLPITLTAPANATAGSRAEFKAAVDWLECEEVCIPGSADVSLALAVGAEPPAADPTWGGKIRATVAALPRPDPAWAVKAGRSGKVVTLHLTPTGKDAGRPAPRSLHFFNAENVIAFDQPQKVGADGRGGYVLTMAATAEAPADAKKLIGVLISEAGWNGSAAQRGLPVDVELGTTLAAVSNTPDLRL